MVLCAALPAQSFAQLGAPPASPAMDARPLGQFEMYARVTAAENVRGEHAGELLKRRWIMLPQSCLGSVCQTLELNRERGATQHEELTLHRVGSGSYVGSASFYVALRCKGKVYQHGSRVPYRITLSVTSAVTVQGIAFARGVTATYESHKRSDSTPCELSPSHDAARYSGSAASAIPQPPVASFSAQVDGRTDTAAFTDTSQATAGTAIVASSWNFGDPASGAADSSSDAMASHQFSAPGVYSVTLTVLDANGLTSTSTQLITAAGGPTAAFASGRSGTATFSFADESQAGIGGAAITAWSWNFGDPASGTADESIAKDPSHEFSDPGVYQVTLTVTDENGRESTTTAQIVVSGPPNAAFTATQAATSATFAFMDTSTAGVDGPPIVSWSWDFGDPDSGAEDASTAEDPSHTFSGPGTYTVTLTVTDADGMTSSTTRQIEF
jgi:PKD repeat protein